MPEPRDVQHGRERISRGEFLKRAGSVGALAVSAGVFSGVASACSSPKASTSSSKTATLTLAAPDDIISLDANLAVSVLDTFIVFAVYEGLQGFMPNGSDTLEYRVAESLEVSPDGLQARFRLKQGVMFHKGYGELTAQDVKFSFERIAGIIKPNINSYMASNWAYLQEVKVLGKYDGIILLKEPYAPLMTVTIPFLSGLIVSEKAVQKLGKAFALNPVGTGPYEFVSWTPGQKAVIRRFEDWHGHPAPDFEEIIFTPGLTDAQTLTISLETNALDLVQVPYSSFSRIQKMPGTTIHSKPTDNYAWIGMNMLHPKLTDINVRQAIRYAIDVPSMITAGFDNQVERATAVISPKMPLGYWKDAPVYNRDLAKAKSYLDKATSKPTSLTLTTYTDSPAANTVAQIAAANLADIGITVSISSKPTELAGSFLRDQELFFLGFDGTAPDPYSATQWFTCAEFDQWNWQYWCDSKADALLNAALHEIDPAKRSAMYIEWQELWNDACNVVWVAWMAEPWAYHSSQIQGAFYVWGDPAVWAFKSV
jgi:peptide/nickel transport system substrate-binding protein